MAEQIYEVWEESWNTFGNESSEMVGRFTNKETARLIAKLRTEGWGRRAHVREASEVDLSDASPQDVYADPQKFGVYRTISHAEMRKLMKEI